MKHKKYIGLGIALVALIIIGFTIRQAVYYAPDTEVAPPAALIAGSTSASTTAVTDGEKPGRLQIPSLEIDAAVQYVGVKADGSMGTPSNFTDTAWYKYGPVPGNTGAAVIDGHVDNALSLPGVFKHLGDIKTGDDVYVVRKDGQRLHFVVDDVETYDYRNAPSDKIFTSSDGKAHLNLITCSGTWVGSEHSYTTRLVVYTTLAQ